MKILGNAYWAAFELPLCSLQADLRARGGERRTHKVLNRGRGKIKAELQQTGAAGYGGVVAMVVSSRPARRAPQGS